MKVNAIIRVTTMSMDAALASRTDRVSALLIDVYSNPSDIRIVYRWDDNSSPVIPNMGLIHATVTPTSQA